jgi:hypothetical protein
MLLFLFSLWVGVTLLTVGIILSCTRMAAWADRHDYCTKARIYRLVH